MKKRLFVLAVSSIFLAACGGNDADKKAEEEKMIQSYDSMANEAESKTQEIKEKVNELDDALKLLEEDNDTTQNENN